MPPQAGKGSSMSNILPYSSREIPKSRKHLLSLEGFASREGLVGPVVLSISMLLMPAEGLAALLSTLVV